MDKLLIQKRTKELVKKADKPEIFIKELQLLLRSYVDKKATQNYQRIIPNTGKFYGVPLPVLRVISAEIGQVIQREPSKASLLLKTVWGEESFEARQIAGKCLEKFGPYNPKLCLDFISSVLAGIDNWAVCDNLAMFGIEPIVYSNPELVLPLSEKWIRSSNKWIRRFGIVTLRGYKKIKVTDKVFKILDVIMKDKDKDVKKAAAWVLREITKKNPQEIFIFLVKWTKAASPDTKWIIKDGMKKLPKKKQEEILATLY